MGQRWQPGDFYDNLAAAADAVGYENLDIALGLAHIRYASLQDREAVLTALTAIPADEVPRA